MMCGAILRGNRHPSGNQICIDHGDITAMDVAAIVNAANTSLLGGGGVDGAIHRAAGPGLLQECKSLHGCRVGDAKMTRGYDLKADHVIHTVGPIYSGKESDKSDLRNCYWNSLELAKANELHTIAFPAISTGAYGYPLEEAVGIAMTTVSEWLGENKDYGMQVVFSCWDERTYEAYTRFLKVETGTMSTASVEAKKEKRT